MSIVRPERSNNGFSKVENTFIDPNTLADSVPAVVKPSSVPPSGVLTLVIDNANTVELTIPMLIQLRQDGFVLWNSQNGSGISNISLGADTAANAATLSAYLGLDDASPRLLHFKQIAGPSQSTSIYLSNSSNDYVWVQVALNGGEPDCEQLFAEDRATSDAYVLVSKTLTSDENLKEGAILFNIVQQAIGNGA